MFKRNTTLDIRNYLGKESSGTITLLVFIEERSSHIYQCLQGLPVFIQLFKAVQSVPCCDSAVPCFELCSNENTGECHFPDTLNKTLLLWVDSTRVHIFVCLFLVQFQRCSVRN